MAEDLRRYLEGEPIRARPASVFYRLRKRLAKQRGLFLALAAAAALVVALGVVGWRYRAASRQLAVAGAFWATHLRAAEFIEWAEDRGRHSTPELVGRKRAELDRVLESVEETHGRTSVSAAYRAWFRYLTREERALDDLDALCRAAPDEPFAPLVRARCRLSRLFQGFSPATLRLESEGQFDVDLHGLDWPAERIALVQADARAPRATRTACGGWRRSCARDRRRASPTPVRGCAGRSTPRTAPSTRPRTRTSRGPPAGCCGAISPSRPRCATPASSRRPRRGWSGRRG